MNIKMIIAAAVLALAMPAYAQFKTVALAHEVGLDELRLPGTESGTLAFKACAKCEYQTERVTPDTQYELNGKRVTLTDMRDALSSVRDRKATIVNVLHHLERDVITKIWVDLQ